MKDFKTNQQPELGLQGNFKLPKKSSSWTKTKGGAFRENKMLEWAIKTETWSAVKNSGQGCLHLLLYIPGLIFFLQSSPDATDQRHNKSPGARTWKHTPSGVKIMMGGIRSAGKRRKTKGSLSRDLSYIKAQTQDRRGSEFASRLVVLPCWERCWNRCRAAAHSRWK